MAKRKYVKSYNQIKALTCWTPEELEVLENLPADSYDPKAFRGIYTWETSCRWLDRDILYSIDAKVHKYYQDLEDADNPALALKDTFSLDAALRVAKLIETLPYDELKPYLSTVSPAESIFLLGLDNAFGIFTRRNRGPIGTHLRSKANLWKRMQSKL